MKSSFKIVSAFLLVLVLSCATNPFTQKSTLALVPNSQILPMAFQQYGQFLSENKVVTGTPDAKRITNVGMKIKSAAERWLTANGNADYLNGYEWEYTLVDDKAVNAWCMPGGKIVFYTGILPICKDDAGIAAVMGHEVAHALANHGQQRMSAGLLQQAGGIGVAIATGNQSPEQQQLWMTAYGAGAQFGALLPFSRNHESEADEIGLLLMAIAGYNPDTAVTFWERMASQAGGEAPPEFMSTHPSNETRIRKIKEQIPFAKKEAAKYGASFK